MNKLIEFIKRIFKRNTLALNESKTIDNEENLNQKEKFLDDIKINDIEENIIIMQKNLENGVIDEDKLTIEQVKKMKNLYCKQILDLLYSIRNYKIKLN